MERESALVWMLVCLALTLPMIGICSYHLGMEATVLFYPTAAFESRSCNVLSVEFIRYQVSGDSCSDVFASTWKLDSSPVVYRKEEIKARKVEECGFDYGISKTNSSFQVGAQECYAILGHFFGYADMLRCDEVLYSNNATAHPCATVSTPESKFRNTNNLAILIFLLLGLIAFGVCTAVYSDKITKVLIYDTMLHRTILSRRRSLDMEDYL